MPAVLATDRLRLRSWREADAEKYRELWLERDTRSMRLIGADGRPTVVDLRRSIRAQLAETARTGIGLMVVERLAEKDVIGYCGLVARDATPDEPEIAYELLHATHGHGYATEAARAVRDAAAASGWSRLWAGVRVWNIASLRVLGKIGFVSAGRIEEDSERGDLVLMTCRLSGDQSRGCPAHGTCSRSSTS